MLTVNYVIKILLALLTAALVPSPSLSS